MMLAGVLRRPSACCAPALQLLTEVAAKDQRVHEDRISSGTRASTSASLESRSFASMAAGAASAAAAARGQRALAPGFPMGMSTAAAAAAAASSGQAEAAPGGSSSNPPGEAAGVPWPWVDSSRPQHLPKQVVRKSAKRSEVPLTQAVHDLLGRLVAGQRQGHSLEVFVRFALDPRRSDHLVRGSVVLPHGTGKSVRLVVFAKGADAEAARKEGVQLIGDEDLIASIVGGDGSNLPFDRLIATPDFMKPLARAGRVLGPKGLMPNPKMGTLTTDVVRAIREARQGRLDYRLGRDGTVKSALGRCSMPPEQLAANAAALAGSLLDSRPKALGKAAPGQEAQGYITTFALKTTFSQPAFIDTRSLYEAAAPYREAAGAEQQAQGAGAAVGGPAPAKAQ